MTLAPLAPPQPNVGATAPQDPFYDYVKDGLILQLDGIRNGINGAHVDTLIQWVDQSGNGNHAIVYSSMPAFNADSWQGDGATYFNLPSSFFDFENNNRKWTIEILCETYTRNVLKNQCAFAITKSLTERLFWLYVWYGSMPENLPRVSIYSNGQQDISLNNASAKQDILQITTTFDVSNGIVYQKGILFTSLSSTNVYSPISSRNIGAYNNDSTRCWYGKIYAIRIYNRPLTDAEVAQNYAIDKIRFNLT